MSVLNPHHVIAGAVGTQITFWTVILAVVGFTEVLPWPVLFALWVIVVAGAAVTALFVLTRSTQRSRTR